MQQIHTAFQQPNKVEMMPFSFLTLVFMVNGYTSDMTRTVAVGKPDQLKKDIYNLTLKPNKLLPWLYQAWCDCPWSGPRCSWGHRKSWLRRVLQPPSWSRYRYGCPRIPHLSWKETTWSSKKACASLLNQVSISLVKSVSVSKTVVLLPRMAFDLFASTSKTLLLFWLIFILNENQKSKPGKLAAGAQNTVWGCR